MMYVVFFALLASLTHIVVAARRFTSTIIYGGRGLNKYKVNQFRYIYLKRTC